MTQKNELIILDFETTGLCPPSDRIIEVGAILVKDNKVVDKLSQLLYPGFALPSFISTLTGISNAMLKSQPRPEEFMPTLYNFIGDRVILAHNASFDKKFLIAELHRISKKINNPLLCTLKLARRLLQAPDYKLTTLVKHLNLKVAKTNKAHRALDDVMSTLQLWLYMHQNLIQRTGKTPDLDLFFKLEKKTKAQVAMQF